MPSVIKVDQIQSDTGNVAVTGNINIDSGLVFVDAVNNRVGINTATPNSSLEIVSQDSLRIRGFQPFLTMYDSNDSLKSFRIQTFSGTTNFQTDPVGNGSFGERARINSFGVGLGGAIPSSGMGIAFPGTQVASSDPNTLDDYEEGSWTPSINGGSSNGVLTNNSSAGSYIKIGSMVWVHCQLHFQCTTAGSGAFSISNLPFVAAAVNGHGFALALGALYNWNIDNSAYQLGARVNESTSSIFFWNNIDNSTDALLSWPFAGGGTQVFGTITGCYRAAS